jgi:RsiW-degrading membrane proteinase PrsW (M82 family)
MQQSRGSSTTAVPGMPVAELVFVSGPGGALSYGPGPAAQLNRVHFSIGRMPGNDLILDDPQVSRYHATVRWLNGQFVIEDLGSANGTWVNGRRITGPTPLLPGQQVTLGQTTLQMRMGSADAMAIPVPSAASLTGRTVVFTTGAMGVQVAAHPHGLRGFLRVQLRRRYWRVFLAGLLLYILVWQVLLWSFNLHLIPIYLLLASGLVPVTFVVLLWDMNALADMPPAPVVMTFFWGAVLGCTVATILETVFPAGAGALAPALVTGTCEEVAKVLAVVFVLRDRRFRLEFDGLILGAAAGMGFAALETAGYGFTSFFIGLQRGGGFTLSGLLGAYQFMSTVLQERMLLAGFGHGIWTAIVCAAIWRERGQRAFRLTSGVLLAFAIAIVLHALWDWEPFSGLAGLVWMVGIGVIGILILRFFIRESLAQARAGSAAQPPAPLGRALLDYFLGPFGLHVLPKPALVPVPAPSGPAMQSGASAAGSATPGRFCPFCHGPVSPTAHFCGSCGRPLGVVP